jgi:hypothetical protein
MVFECGPVLDGHHADAVQKIDAWLRRQGRLGKLLGGRK